jgi:hypothetical protein
MKKLLQIFCLILISGLTQAQIPTDNLVAWFPFNGNANDVSGNGHNGTVYGATLTTDRFGNTNSAYYFDGIDNRITANIGTLTVQSFSFWWKAPQPTSDWDDMVYYNYLYCQIPGNGSPSAYGKVYLRKQLSYHNAYSVLSPNVPSYNNWHYVYYDYTPSSNAMNLYIDDVFIGSGIYSNDGGAVPFDTTTLTLGSHPDSISGHFFSGILDDLRIYSRILTPAEITALYNESSSYAITATPSPLNAGSTSGGGIYKTGTEATLLAIADTGWSFLNWTENGTVVSTTPNYSIIVIGARNLVANFVQQSVLITADANPISGGITSGGGYYGIGSQVSLLATPNVGYSFLNWTEFGSQVSTSPNYVFIASTNRNLVANYSTTGVEELSSSTLVYPNPTSGIVMIKSCQNIKTVEIVNSMGRTMKSHEFQHLDGKIDLSNFPKGIYFIHFTYEDRAFTQKIVVM